MDMQISIARHANLCFCRPIGMFLFVPALHTCLPKTTNNISNETQLTNDGRDSAKLIIQFLENKKGNTQFIGVICYEYNKFNESELVAYQMRLEQMVEGRQRVQMDLVRLSPKDLKKREIVYITNQIYQQ